MIKHLLLTAMLLTGWVGVSTAFATGALGGNPGCESGGINVGHAPCGQKPKAPSIQP
ncbi:MAG: hypothetical protein ACPHV3_07265 [Vibrio sp.]